MASGTVSCLTRRGYFSASGAQLLTDGAPVVAQLDGNGGFSVQLDTYDDILKPTPYAMVVCDAQGKFLMERFLYFQGGGAQILNNVPNQNDGSAFAPQYPSDTGYRLIQGSFGSSAANGTVTFKLYQQAFAAEGVQVVPTPLTYNLDGSGDLPAGVYLYLSADLKPNTVYLVTVNDSNGNEISKATKYPSPETMPAVTDLNDLSPSVPVAGVAYPTVPGVFFSAVPWKKS